MDGLENISYLIGYVISNAVALVLIWMAWKHPRNTRLLFFLLFGWACWMNWSTALENPQFYLEYADLAFLDSYQLFIRGWFSNHIIEMVGFIATCQGLIAVSFLLKGRVYKLGIIGAMVFLMAIAPLGVGSAFPFSLTTSFALYLLLKAYPVDYIWEKPAALIKSGKLNRR